METDTHIQSLYRKFIANRCSAAEIAQVLDSLKNAGNETLFRQLMAAGFETEMEGGAEIDAAISARIREKILAGMAAGEAVVPVKRLAWQPFMKVAAGLVLGLLLGAAAYLLHVPRAEPTVAYAENLVPRGMKMTLRLAYGTQVWLNAGSRFRYPKSFAGATRRV